MTKLQIIREIILLNSLDIRLINQNNDIEGNPMRYLKDIVPFRSFLSFFYVLLSLTSLIVLSEYDNKVMYYYHQNHYNRYQK
jgi:hypothetical protein